MNEDNNNDNIVLNQSNDLPVIAEESGADTLLDVVAEPVADTDELPAVTTESEQA